MNNEHPYQCKINIAALHRYPCKCVSKEPKEMSSKNTDMSINMSSKEPKHLHSPLDDCIPTCPKDDLLYPKFEEPKHIINEYLWNLLVKNKGESYVKKHYILNKFIKMTENSKDNFDEDMIDGEKWHVAKGSDTRMLIEPDPSLNTWERDWHSKMQRILEKNYKPETSVYLQASYELSELIKSQISLAVQKEREESIKGLNRAKVTTKIHDIPTVFVYLDDALAIVNKGVEEK